MAKHEEWASWRGITGAVVCLWGEGGIKMLHAKSLTMGRVVLWAVVLMLWAMPLSAAAQWIIIEPPMPPVWPGPVAPGPIAVDEVVVEATVRGPVATVRVSQMFRNQSGDTVEGQFMFPLPVDAAVSDLQMKVDGQVLEGVILPADEARAVYERIVREQRDPALLQYVGNGLFQTKVFPIPPGATRTVQLTYTEVVAQAQGLYRFRYPVGHGASFGGLAALSQAGGLRIRVDLVDQPGLRTVYSPNYGASVTRTAEDRAEIVFTGAGELLGSFFEVYWGTADRALGVNLLSYRPVEEDGYFTLLAAPALEEAATEVVARDVILVLDVSGSMEGEKMAQARAAAVYLVDHLNPGDRFNLLSFSTGVRLWSASLVPVGEEAAADAYAWIERLDASGSTDINRALLDVLGLVAARPAGESDRPVYILFMTDGLPTQGETDYWRILDNAATNMPRVATLRLFTFGVGFDVNTILLDTLSKEMGGRSSYVQPTERIDEAVSQFYARISTPVLTNVQVDLAGAGVVDEVYPFPLPDLFAGEQLVVAGRYREGGPVTVIVRGEVNGARQELRFEGLSLATRGGEPFVARLWASRKIGVLMEQIRRFGPEREAIDEIVALSLRYGIVTPYTAYLVEEPTLAGPMEEEITPTGAPAAMAYAEDAAARMAAMPASGEGAVAASEAQNTLQTATAVANAAQAQYVAGKSFVRQGWLSDPAGAALPFWVDTAYRSDLTLRWVLFGSDAYFALAAEPTIAAWLAVGAELVIATDEGFAWRITTRPELVPGEEPAPTVPAMTPEATAIPAAEAAPTNGWGAFWLWLWETLTP